VTFRWKDYAHGSKQGKMTLGATEFLRRFFLHVLPKGFVRIRHFGFLANRLRASRLALGRQLLTSNGSTAEEVPAHEFRSETLFSLALPTLRHIDDGDSEIYCCGTISMHVLRFFLMPSSPTTRGCAPARRYIRVLTRSPRPLSPPSTNPPAALCTTARRLDRLFRCLLIDLLHPKPPFKSHSAPRPPQTPAASS